MQKLEEPAIELLNSVYGFLDEIAVEILNKLFLRFPTLNDIIGEALTKVLQKERERTKEIVQSIISAERDYLFTNDADYLGNRTNLIPVILYFV